MGRPVTVCVCMFMVGVRVMSLMWETPSLVIHSSRPLSAAWRGAAASIRPPLPWPPSRFPSLPRLYRASRNLEESRRRRCRRREGPLLRQ